MFAVDEDEAAEDIFLSSLTYLKTFGMEKGHLQALQGVLPWMTATSYCSQACHAGLRTLYTEAVLANLALLQ